MLGRVGKYEVDSPWDVIVSVVLYIGMIVLLGIGGLRRKKK